VTDGRYEVELSPAAERALRKLEKSDRRTAERIVAALEDLEADPRPAGVSALTGYPAALRIRVGDWRVVYRVEEARLLVLVLQIGHRREIYRGL